MSGELVDGNGGHRKRDRQRDRQTVTARLRQLMQVRLLECLSFEDIAVLFDVLLTKS